MDDLMAEIAFFQGDETPYWSHDLDLNLPPSDLDLNLPQSDLNLEPDLGLGFLIDSLGADDDDVDDYNCGFMSGLCGTESFLSDEDDIFLNGNTGDDDTNNVQILDSFRLDEEERELREVREDFEWEEVDGGVDERDVLSVFFDADVDDDLDMSVSMEIPSEEDLGTDQVTNLEWEVLLNIQNLDSNLDDVDDVDDEYEMLVGAELRRPPASKAAVENLAVVVVTADDVAGEDALCPICKDDMGVGEKAKMLPCLHCYHGSCIERWLGMRNTCPICRYELATDDPEYERRRSERGGRV